eukprot:TRINITY_DN32325_c0_g1_i1.p1 TRINITY_DN32325_c0_g1~~TRINITY_DN32325_c0_g1_i1.p1  ORF type:complete len:352 (+),score=37.01 TRINITY_DN32325_c0_g1_i1:98-1153(+)
MGTPWTSCRCQLERWYRWRFLPVCLAVLVLFVCLPGIWLAHRYATCCSAPIDASQRDLVDEPIECWPRREASGEAPDSLEAVVYARITQAAADNATVDLLRWLQWAKYAGVSRVYLYDTAFSRKDVRLHQIPYIRILQTSGFLTLRRHPIKPPWPLDHHMQIYRDALKRFNIKGWLLCVDMDEYVFSPVDRQPGFLWRHLQSLPSKVAVAMMSNYLVGGIESSVSSSEAGHVAVGEEMPVVKRPRSCIERFVHRVSDDGAKADPRRKYVAHVQRTCRYSVHGAVPLAGFTRIEIPGDKLRFHHCWGVRISEVNARRWYEADSSLLAPLQRARDSLLPDYDRPEVYAINYSL